MATRIKTRGKVQTFLVSQLEAVGPGVEISINDMLDDFTRELRGVHYGRLMSAASALAKKDAIRYDGSHLVELSV